MNTSPDPGVVIRGVNERYIDLVFSLFDGEIREFRGSGQSVADFIRGWLEGPEPDKVAERAPDIGAAISTFWGQDHGDTALFSGVVDSD